MVLIALIDVEVSEIHGTWVFKIMEGRVYGKQKRDVMDPGCFIFG